MGTAALRTEITNSLSQRFGIDLKIRNKTVADVLSTGLSNIDIPRGTLTEICGPPSSGRSGILNGTSRGLPGARNSARSSTPAITSIPCRR